MASFLVSDFGIAHTRTLLIDVVEGQHRFIIGTLSRTTVAPPDEDATIALSRNIDQLNAITGREYMNDQGFTDQFIATASSAGQPLRAVLVGLMDISIASARRALTGTYIEVVETLSISHDQSEEERINIILRSRPNVIFIVGGTNDGNETLVRSLVQVVELAIKLVPVEQRPIVLYAGNERLKSWVYERLKDPCVLFIADNVRPIVEQESLTSAKLKLAQVFDDFLKRQPGGFKDISEYSSTGIIPTAQSAANLVRYLDTLNEERGVLYLDVGSGTSSLLTSRDEQPTAHIRSNIGLGHNILEVLNEVDWRDVERWLPFPFSLERLEEWVNNKWLSPLTIPHTLRDLFIEYAIAREIVHVLLQEAQEEWALEGKIKIPTFSPVIMAGAVFTSNVSPGLAAMLVLDALQLPGVVELWQDPYSLASALGAVSYVDPAAVVQVVDNGGFVRLGTAFCPAGSTRQLRASMKVKITLPNGEVIQKQVNVGDIWIAPLRPGTLVDIQIRLPRGLSLDGKRRLNQQVRAGTAGLIFDMRGRPFKMPSGRRRRQTIGGWFTAATGIGLDETMFEDLPEAMEAPALDEMTAFMDTTPALDFPTLESLPQREADPAFLALFEEEKSDTDAVDDFARELGLR